MSAFFITATGTGVGKTHLTERLIRLLRDAGRSVDAVKPVISGFDPDGWHGSDTGRLLAALGEPLTAEAAEALSPWRFRAPLSPDVAAAREGRTIDFRALVNTCVERQLFADGPLLIEGVGGVMVPLDDEHTVLDWLAALQAPVVLVAGTCLGTISHCLTALTALTARGITARALVLSDRGDAPMPPEETAAVLSRFTTVPILPLRRADGAAISPPERDELEAIAARIGLQH